MPLLNSKLVTGDSAFSMFNLSLREEWANNKTFCHRLTEEADAEDKAGEHAENNKAKVCFRQCVSNGFRERGSRVAGIFLPRPYANTSSPFA